MAHFNVKLFGLKTETGRFTKAFDSKAEVLMKKAAAAWLRAVIVRVPVWTGFARGSLKFADGPRGNLSRFLQVAVPITGRRKTPKWYYHPGRGKVEKTPENAGRFAHYTFSTSRHVYTFTFTSTVVHYLIEEFFGQVSPTAPWLSMEAGRQAWLEYFDAHILDLPKLKDFTYPVPVVELTKGQLKILRESNNG